MPPQNTKSIHIICLSLFVITEISQYFLSFNSESVISWLTILEKRKNFQIPLRTPQRPQPVVDPNMVCVHFTFWCHKCTHFAWISYTAFKSKCYPACIYLNGSLLFLVHTLRLTQLPYTTYPHLWCTHCAWISCTNSYLHFITASVQYRSV